MLNTLKKKQEFLVLERWCVLTYFTAHIKVPVDSSGPIQESISIIGDAAIHQAL